MNPLPLISVVIPTRGRPQMVARAVQSVLRQTYSNFEIVVVLDGPDPVALKSLNAIGDTRLRLILRDEPGGGSNARNTGVESARGEWVAFLDDDDEWRPHKLETQLRLAQEHYDEEVIVSCLLFARTQIGDTLWPQTIPQDGQPVSEYLLVRKGFRRTEGFITTSTIFTRRALLLKVPFKQGLKRHQDWDWVLRATSEGGAKVLFSREPLVIWHLEHELSVSRRPDWRYSWNWIKEMKHHVTPRAYTSFITCHVAWQAAAERQWNAFVPLLMDARRHGPLGLKDILRYSGFWFVPKSVRFRINAVKV